VDVSENSSSGGGLLPYVVIDDAGGLDSGANVTKSNVRSFISLDHAVQPPGVTDARTLPSQSASRSTRRPVKSRRRQQWSARRRRSQIASLNRGSLCRSFGKLAVVIGQLTSLSAT